MQIKFDTMQFLSSVKHMTFSLWLCWIWYHSYPCIKPSHRDTATNRKGARQFVFYDLAHINIGIKEDYNGEGTVPLSLSKEINLSINSAASHEELLGQAFLIYTSPFICFHIKSKSSPSYGIQSTIQ